MDTAAEPKTVFVLRPSGHFDALAASLCKEAWLDIAERERPDVIELDLRGVTSLDVGAMGLLILLHRRQRDHGARLTLTGASPAVLHRLKATGVGHVLGVADV